MPRNYLVSRHFFYFLKKSMNIKKIIKEVVDNFINEELSISEYIIKGVTYSTNRLIEKYKEMYGNGGTIDDYTVTNINDIVSFGDFGSIDCYVTIIDFPSKIEMKEGFKKYEFGGETDQVNYRINMTIMSLNREIDDNFLYNTLYHESEHVYQFLRNGKGLHTTLSAYNKAVRIIDGRDTEHNSEEYKIVANLIYYFNKTEIEANVNGLYGELIHNGCDINETNFKVNFDAYKDILKDLINSYDDERFSNVFSYFNTTYGKLISFVKRQEEYIMYRTRKVYQKAWNDLGNPTNENKIIKPLGFYSKK